MPAYWVDVVTGASGEPQRRQEFEAGDDAAAADRAAELIAQHAAGDAEYGELYRIGDDAGAFTQGEYLGEVDPPQPEMEAGG